MKKVLLQFYMAGKSILKEKKANRLQPKGSKQIYYKLSIAHLRGFLNG